MTDNEITASAAPTQAKINKIGFDNLLEDIFGLNIRALKTIGVLFKSPAKYFRAALTPEWQNKYTPSFRVWFGMLAMLVALNFLYNNDRSVVTGYYEGLLDQMAIDLTQSYNLNHAGHDHGPSKYVIDPNAAAKGVVKWSMVYFPFAYIPFMALAGLLVRFWGQRLSYVTRLRYLFAVVIPSVTFMFLSTFLVLVINEASYVWVSITMLISMAGLDFTTAYRGAFQTMTKAKRVWRSFALTTILFLIYICGSFTAGLPAMWKVVDSHMERVEVQVEPPQPNTALPTPTE